MEGRKDYITVDALGLPMAVKMPTANIHDSVGLKPIKQLLRCKTLV